MIDELGSYSLSDFLLFSRETYFALFERYNESVWPAHILALLLGAGLVWITSGRSIRLPTRIRNSTSRIQLHRGRIAALILLSACGWVGWAFFLQRYQTINPFASYLGVLFFIETGLLFWFGLVFGRIEFAQPIGSASQPLPTASPPGKESSPTKRITRRPAAIGVAMIGYALVIHPLIGLVAGRSFSQLAVFGLAPDPTAVAALGFTIAGRRPNWLLLLPMLLWCIVSALTAIGLKSIEGAVPAAAGAVALIATIWKTVVARGHRSDAGVSQIS